MDMRQEPAVITDMNEEFQETVLQEAVFKELPRYKCHKEVWALKIKAVALGNGRDIGGIVTPEDDGYLPFIVSVEYMKKHKPQAGGYYVIYADGYKSFSPGKAFEEGYSRA